MSKTKFLLTSILVALLSFGLITPVSAAPYSSSEATDSIVTAKKRLRLNVVTYNVLKDNSGATVRKDIVHLMKTHDVALLQETLNINLKYQLRNRQDLIVLHTKGRSEKRNVTIILKKGKIKQVKNHWVTCVYCGPEFYNRWAIWAVVKLRNGATVRIGTTHFPSMANDHLHPRTATNLVKNMNNSKNPLIVGGDFNFYKDPQNIAKRTKTQYRAKGIDAFYVERRPKIRIINTVNLKYLNSDHNPVRTVLSIAP